MTHQLTIRYDDELAQRIEELAEQEGISRNQAVLRLLRKGAGIYPPNDEGVIGHALDHHFGTWTAEEVREFEEAVADFEKIDEELWK